MKPNEQLLTVSYRPSDAVLLCMFLWSSLAVGDAVALLASMKQVKKSVNMCAWDSVHMKPIRQF